MQLDFGSSSALNLNYLKCRTLLIFQFKAQETSDGECIRKTAHQKHFVLIHSDDTGLVSAINLHCTHFG